jgi:hypothetical protein
LNPHSVFDSVTSLSFHTNKSPRRGIYRYQSGRDDNGYEYVLSLGYPLYKFFVCVWPSATFENNTHPPEKNTRLHGQTNNYN